MSLFPAYSDQEKSVNENLENKSTSEQPWLSNSTFKAPEDQPESTSTSSSDSERRHKEKKHSKLRKKHKKKQKCEFDHDKNVTLFYEDTTAQHYSHSKIEIPQIKLTEPASSHASHSQNKKKKKKKNKKSNKERYFYKKLDEENELNLLTINEQPMEIDEFLKKTEMFNKCLRNDPHDIKMWLDYIKLQDSGIGSIKGRCEKKLSIIDKALSENPESEDIFLQKMLISESMFPMDKVGMEAKAVVAKYPKNLIGWQWVLNSSQYNLSKMTAPGVLLTYEQVLQGVYKAYPDSEPFLDFIFLCGLFLRQCGLWEQLWVLLELYLELNLSTAGSRAFRVEQKLPEVEIQQLEDSIITSGLPLGSLWLRVERLREGVYFLPVEESPDPQRVVFKEDMTPLLFPLQKSSSSVLLVRTLLLLKVPPLPMTDSFFRFTGQHKVPWFLDSVELVLAARFSKGDSSYLDIVPELLIGPQYLSEALGRSEFFQFVNTVFDKCIAHSQTDSIAFIIWQLRWWRWICNSQKKTDDQTIFSKKHYLSLAKKLLKQNRDSIPLYTEYALFEEESGDFEASIKILETTMALRDPPLLAGRIYRRDLCNLYRVYIEVLIRKDVIVHREKILTALVALAFGENIKHVVLRDEIISKCNDKFKHVSTEVIRDLSQDTSFNFINILLPDFSTSWLVCHAWFLFFTEGIWKCTGLLEKVINDFQKQIEPNSQSMLNIILEGIFEGLLQIFTHHCASNPGNYGKLFDLTERAVKLFPNNAFFLNTIYSCELAGMKWSKFSSDIFSSDSVMASALVYFMSHSRLLNDDSLKATAAQRLLAILERLKNKYERCPLFLRLLLQAKSQRESVEIKTAFYRSVEKCPWVKNLYYEAAKILPEDLPEIQDLLIEKELRLHITPEELEILREGS